MVWLGGEGLNEGVLGQEGAWLCLCGLCLSQSFPPFAWSPGKVPCPPPAPLAEGPCLRGGLLSQGVECRAGAWQWMDPGRVLLLLISSCSRRPLVPPPCPLGVLLGKGGQQAEHRAERGAFSLGWMCSLGGFILGDVQTCSPPRSLLCGARLKPQML